MSNGRVVILGAGHAGGSAAAFLRQYGHTGPIALIGEEPIAPYQRPPLSKAWLKGEADAESLALKPLEFYAAHNIEFRAGVKATRIHRPAKTVRLQDGVSLAYDTLILATGVRPIGLPVEGADLDGVLSLRTAADAEALKLRLAAGKTLVVVGGGYIGLEVAASARSLGAKVVVIEREDRMLARVACTTLSDFFQARHLAKGVRLELNASVAGFVGEQGGIRAVQLADGRQIACDVAVVGVGARPNDELAARAGLECASGVVVDQDARSISDPNIFAIGDVAQRPVPVYERMLRLESVPNALEQAKQAAAAITGRPRPAPECPWQWSDQYDLKLQIAGYALDTDDVVVRGYPDSSVFAVFYMKGDVVRSVAAVNAPPEFMMGKQLVLTQAPVDKAKLSDTTVSMKVVVA
ncbi:NAD(P)/FAD-dependent oxidoreductase [Caulobacter segnis]|uniref:Ferredoxin reductase n=1 Tax=Caulobacter segnis TaxID=88688 RepID=A0A2W5UXU3_9CAUL|nr:FAD-dependent oxidoreductase [Caulobacter segnis]PZR32629.1 MAG: ferredoxin reductase [Caulobacter segnis]